MWLHGTGSSIYDDPHLQSNPDPVVYDDQSDEVQSPSSRNEEGPTESRPVSTSLRSDDDALYRGEWVQADPSDADKMSRAMMRLKKISIVLNSIIAVVMGGGVFVVGLDTGDGSWIAVGAVAFTVFSLLAVWAMRMNVNTIMGAVRLSDLAETIGMDDHASIAFKSDEISSYYDSDGRRQETSSSFEVKWACVESRDHDALLEDWASARLMVRIVWGHDVQDDPILCWVEVRAEDNGGDGSGAPAIMMRMIVKNSDRDLIQEYAQSKVKFREFVKLMVDDDHVRRVGKDPSVESFSSIASNAIAIHPRID
jgi:hypothetical protein